MFSKVKQEYHDYDYIDKLSPEEADWLSRFTEEYLGANLTHKGKKLHRTKAMRKDCYSRNNSRQRDIYSIKRATGALDMEDVLILHQDQLDEIINSTFEESLIDFLDSGNDTGDDTSRE